MFEYNHTKSMHQFYRDIFSRDLELGNIGNFPKEFIASIVAGSLDTLSIYKTILTYDSGLENNHDIALKQLLLTISLANLALDEKFEGKKVKLPDEYINNIRSSLVEIIKLWPSVEYLVVAIQLLFRVGDVEPVVELINNNFSVLADSPAAFRILLIICMIEENFDMALPLIKEMTSNQKLVGEHWLVLLMVTCAIYKLGGYPDSYIDFRPLLNEDDYFPIEEYLWLIDKDCKNEKVNVVVSCDEKYYFQHAVYALYSIYETNKSNFNVHFHIYNITDDVLVDIKKNKKKFPELNISCTAESVPMVSGVNVHFASRRFLFSHYALSVWDGPVLIIDADCLMRKDLSSVISPEKPCDLILTETKSAPFWEKALAGFVYLDGGEVSKQFISKVASFISVNLVNGNNVWFLDQVALSASLDAVKISPLVCRVDSDIVCDTDHNDHSFMWVVTTVKSSEGKYFTYKRQLADKYSGSDFIQP
ncbi:MULTISPECIES: hypothetical protein [Pectobacterium]|uniref:hypothetical protein n=1 Tax=Pectobacterium TaxID=122277 RepID=UPI0018DACFD6|nr:MULTISPECIES: hypothetical protein [Pectobacterium]QPI41540.1 hypothetical protein I2D83_13655 [Pectobacterium aroidearum]